MRIGDIMIIFVRWRWSKQRRRRLHTVAVRSGGVAAQAYISMNDAPVGKFSPRARIWSGAILKHEVDIMAVKHRESVDETASLLDSCASTHADFSDMEYVLRHDFASHQYAQRFAPTRFLVSVFEPEQQGPSLFRDPRIRVCAHKYLLRQPDDADFYNMVSSVRDAMSTGLNPRMISLGTSGSYFVCDHGNGDEPRIRGVFKPMDEEPYGNLKCVFSQLTSVPNVYFCASTFGGPWAVLGACSNTDTQPDS